MKATLDKWERNFDLIICTNSGLLPLEDMYFPLLRPEGVICLCGLPEEKLPAMFGQVIVRRSVALAGSLIAGTKEIKEMLQRKSWS
jgi:alcohol dehydrogenase (NADP+)